MQIANIPLSIFKVYSNPYFSYKIKIILYEKYGLEYTLKMLNGMFAICILDLKKKKFLARDRFGIKPLYYIKNENFFFHFHLRLSHF